MANGNVYAPLYNSVRARGRLSPLGAPGAIRPYEKKKSLGEKAAGALGAMIEEASKEEKVSKKERYSQLIKRNSELGSKLKARKTNRQVGKDGKINALSYGGDILIQDPNLPKEIRDLNLATNRVPNPNYVPAINQFQDNFAGEPSIAEVEYWHNQREIESMEGNERRGSSGESLYPNYESEFFDEQPTVRRQSGLGKLLKYMYDK